MYVCIYMCVCMCMYIWLVEIDGNRKNKLFSNAEVLLYTGKSRVAVRNKKRIDCLCSILRRIFQRNNADLREREREIRHVLDYPFTLTFRCVTMCLKILSCTLTSVSSNWLMFKDISGDFTRAKTKTSDICKLRSPIKFRITPQNLIFPYPLVKNKRVKLQNAKPKQWLENV